MPTIIPYLSALQLFYIYSFTEKSPSIWYANGEQNLVGLFKKSDPRLRKIYQWDMHKLSDMIGYGEGGFKTISPYDSTWHNIWIKNFNDNAGSEILKRAEAGFVPNIENLIEASNFTYTGGFGITPLIPARNTAPTYSRPASNLEYAVGSDVWMGEMALYNIALFPAMPFVVASSIPAHYHFGPVFMRHMVFSVDSANGSLSPVTISIEFGGGRSIVNAGIPKNVPNQILVTQPSKMFDLPNVYYPSSEIMRPYRFATISDCEIAFETFENVSQFLENTFVTSHPDVYRIEAMKLDITQNVNFIVTDCSNSVPTSRTDIHGPKFAEITSRNVTGSITFAGRKGSIYDDIENLIFDQPLSLYFGGPFYFPMNHVDWAMPSVNMDGGGVWRHTYNFVAKITDNAQMVGFDYETGGYPTSEFNIPAINPNSTGIPPINGGFGYGGEFNFGE